MAASSFLEALPRCSFHIQVGVWNQQVAALSIPDCNNNHSIKTGSSLSSTVALVVDIKQEIVTGNPNAC